MMLLAIAIAAAPPPTWAGTVGDVFEEACVQCHHAGGESPFALQLHEDVARRAAFIGTLVREGIMPPRRLDDHGLTPDQRQLIADWVAAGAPEGDRGRVLLRPAGEQPGDLQVQMAEPWTMPAEGGPNWGFVRRDKRTFVLPLGNEQQLQVTGITHVTSVPGAVHGTTFTTDTRGRARWLDDSEPGPGYRQRGDMGWSPTGALGATGVGRRSVHLPQGFHWTVPTHADLVAQVNFRPEGRERALKESFELHTTEATNSRPLVPLTTMVRQITLAPDETRTFTDTLTLAHAVDVVALLPRADGLCTALSITATTTDGAMVPLAAHDAWDPHWQHLHVLQAPVRLPAGTSIKSTWTLANTAENPRNPFLPLGDVQAGMRTGALSWVMHAAAVDPLQTATLDAWATGQVRARQR